MHRPKPNPWILQTIKTKHKAQEAEWPVQDQTAGMWWRQREIPYLLTHSDAIFSTLYAHDSSTIYPLSWLYSSAPLPPPTAKLLKLWEKLNQMKLQSSISIQSISEILHYFYRVSYLPKKPSVIWMTLGRYQPRNKWMSCSISQRRKSRQKEMTNILEIYQKYTFIKMNNKGEQSQNLSIKVLFPNMTTTQKDVF